MSSLFFVLLAIFAHIGVLAIGALTLMTNVWILHHTSPRILRLTTGCVMLIGICILLMWIVIIINPCHWDATLLFRIGKYNDCAYICSMTLIGDAFINPQKKLLRPVLQVVASIALIIIISQLLFPCNEIIMYSLTFICIVLVIIHQKILVNKHDLKLKQHYIDIKGHSYSWSYNALILLIALAIIYIIINIVFTIIQYSTEIYKVTIIVDNVASAIIWTIIVSQILSIKTDDETNIDDNENKNEDANKIENNSQAIWIECLNQKMKDEKIYLEPDLTISKLATMIGTNRTYLSNYLKYQLHTNFYDYINNKKLSYIQELMKDPSLTLTSIATMSGYHDIRTFRRLFADKFGCTPTEYRNNLLK